MLKPIKAPLPCFGLEYEAEDKRCQACPHVTGCLDFMGDRLNRVTLDKVVFDLLPEGLKDRSPIKTDEEKDMESIYVDAHKLIFGSPPNGSVGKFRQPLMDLAHKARCSTRMFMLTVMFGHLQNDDGKPFTAGQLADNRAMSRVRTFAEACREKFATFDVNSFDRLTGSDNSTYDIHTRMLRSETFAGRWIIQYKMRNAGLPYLPLFEAMEDELDPDWLAIEHNYVAVINSYAVREDSGKAQETRHMTLKAYAQMKKHKHHAIAAFRARERIMAKAVQNVLSEGYFSPKDFEHKNQPVTDPLKFWNRLALAIQHLECLKALYLKEGIYSRSASTL